MAEQSEYTAHWITNPRAPENKRTLTATNYSDAYDEMIEYLLSLPRAHFGCVAWIKPEA